MTSFECPICSYAGPFRPANDPSGQRLHAICPGCSALERHRIQWLVMKRVSEQIDFSRRRFLHVAPEPFFRDRFKPWFHSYESADLRYRNVDHKIDLRKLPFDDGSFDFVFASHVLEHIKEDELALSEIRRILSADGIACLPVPILGDTTVEYPEPNRAEWGHVRAPGKDYYRRYDHHFASVHTFSSEDFDPVHQPFIFEDRTRWPPKQMPLRQRSPGRKHLDLVPVCFARPQPR